MVSHSQSWARPALGRMSSQGSRSGRFKIGAEVWDQQQLWQRPQEMLSGLIQMLCAIVGTPDSFTLTGKVYQPVPTCPELPCS